MTIILRFTSPNITDHDVSMWIKQNSDIVKIIDNKYDCKNIIAFYEESAAIDFKIRFNPIEKYRYRNG